MFGQKKKLKIHNYRHCRSRFTVFRLGIVSLLEKSKKENDTIHMRFQNKP